MLTSELENRRASRRKLAIASGVKGGQTDRQTGGEGTGEAGPDGERVLCCSRTPPSAQAQPQMVTSAHSCAGTFALCSPAVLWRTAGLRDHSHKGLYF